MEAAAAKVKAWVDGRQATLEASSDGWKENRQLPELNERADDAEAYAVAAFELAIAAADEAAQATLEALLARRDATDAALPLRWASVRPGDAQTRLEDR